MHPDTQQAYRWPHRSPLDTPVAELPLATHADVMATANDTREALIEAGWTDVQVREAGTETDKDEAHKSAKQGNGGLVSLPMLKTMLSHIDPGLGRKESGSWISVLGALKHAEACELVCQPDTFDADPAFDAEAVAVEWSRGDYWKHGQPANFASEADVTKNFSGLSPFAPRGSTIATIVRMARDGGYKGDSRVDSLMDRYADAEESANATPAVPYGANGDHMPDEPDTEDLFPVFAENEGLEGPPLDWIIPGVLPMGYQVMLYGEEQSLKTFVMLEMMECAMTGHRFRASSGRYGVRPSGAEAGTLRHADLW